MQVTEGTTAAADGVVDKKFTNNFFNELSQINNKIEKRVADLIQKLIEKINIDNVAAAYVLSAETRKQCHSIYEEAARMHGKCTLEQAKEVRAKQKAMLPSVVTAGGSLLPAIVTPLAALFVDKKLSEIIGKASGGTMGAGGSCMSGRNQGDAGYAKAQEENGRNAQQLANNAASAEDQQADGYLRTAETVRDAARQARQAMMR